jgi:cytochrome c oxidase subunit IV
MTGSQRETDSSWNIWKGPGLVWLALMALFLASLVWAYRALFPGHFTVNLVIAGLMLALLATFLMDLRNAKALIRIVAAAGLFWLIIMFVLTFTDYLSRHH